MLAYLRLLVRDRLLAMLPTGSQRAGQSKAKAVFAFIGFAALALVLYAMVVVLEYYVFQGFAMIGQPGGALAVTFLLCVFITLFLSFFMVFTTLFFSKDTEMVSALPISSRGLLFDKLSIIALGEACTALLVCLPVIILYGLHVGASFWLYVKMVLFVPFLSMIPMVIVAALSFGLIRISALWKRREGVTTIVTLLFVASIMIFQVNFSMSMSDTQGEHLGLAIQQLVMNQSALVGTIVRAFPPVGWLCDALMKTGASAWGMGILFAGVSLAVFALLVWLLGPRYQTLAMKQSEVLTRLNSRAKKGKADWRQRTPIAALYRREISEILTVTPYATNCLVQIIMFPIMMVVMLISMGRYTNGIPATSWMLSLVPPTVFFLIFLAVFWFTCFMNIAVSTAVSREGKRRYFAKIIPVPASTQLLAKLLMGLTITGVTIALTAVTLGIMLPTLWPQVLAGAVASLPFALLTCVLGLLMDVYHPRLNWKSETEAVKRNMNGVFSMLSTLALMGLFIAGFFWLGSLGLAQNLSILLILALIVILDVLLIIWLLGSASKTYLLQEKYA